MSKSNSELVEALKEAFKERRRPEILSGSNSLADFEKQELDEFCVSHYSDLTSSLLEENYGALSWMNSDAFAFYLPWILGKSIEDDSPDNMSVDSILSMLDRGGDSSIWDDFFNSRWRFFSIQELTSIEKWLSWAFNNMVHNSFDRAFTTMRILKFEAEN